MKTGTKVGITAGGVVVCLLLYGLIYPSVKGFPERLKLQASRNLLNQVVAAEEAYFREHGEYVSARPYPQGRAGSESLVWDLAQSPDHGFVKLSVDPEGDVFCRIGVVAEADAFTVEMECDPDDSGKPVYIGLVRPSTGNRDGIVGPFDKCPIAGVISSRSMERIASEGIESYRFLPGACNERSATVMGMSPTKGNKP